MNASCVELKGSHTLEHLVELATSHARLLSRFLLCVDIFMKILPREALRKIYIVFDILALRGKILNVCGQRELLAR